MYRLVKDTNEVAWLFHFDFSSFRPPSYLASVPVSSPPLSFYLSVFVSLSLLLSLYLSSSLSLPLTPTYIINQVVLVALHLLKRLTALEPKLLFWIMWNRHLQVRIEVMNDWLSKLEGIVIENMDDWMSELDEIV